MPETPETPETPSVEIDPPVTNEVSAGTYTALRFDALLGTLDVDGDGRLDQSDVAGLEGCVEQADAAERPECDLVSDGVLDERDVRLLRVLTGEHRPASAEKRSRIADTLVRLAESDDDPGVVALSPDYDGDGTPSVGDVRLFAALLKDDPLARLDLNDDGLLSYADMRVMSLALHEEASPPADWDLNGDDVVDDYDLLLVGTLASSAADITPGALDYNLDGAVSRADFCVTAKARDAGLLELFLPADVAASLFASAPPRVGVCRSDGASVIRYPSVMSTPLELSLFTDALFLEAVSEVPAGWSPPGDVVDGVSLFVLSTTPSARPVAWISLPLASPTNDLSSRLHVAGEALPTGAVVVTPNGFIPVGAAATMEGFTAPLPGEESPGFSGNGPGGGSTHTITVVGNVLQRSDAGEAAAFEAALEQALETYEGYINGCPCELDGAMRAEMVRGLLRMGNCLEAVQSAALAALEDAQANHRVLANEHVYQGRISALSWEYLSMTVEHVAWANVMLLVAETAYDGATATPEEGGPLLGALKSALGNFASELVNDHVLPDEDFFKAGDPSGQIAKTLQDMNLGAVSGALTGTVVDSINALVKESGEATAKHFTETILEQVAANAGSLTDIVGVESILKAIIKMLPNLYLEYVKREAFHQNQVSLDALNRYRASMFTVANWQGVINGMTTARAKVDDTLSRLLAKFDADGCPMTLSTSDPCQPPLQVALQEAGDALADDLQAADDAIAAAFSGLEGTDAPRQECFSGGARQALDQAQLEYRDAAARVAALVGEVDIEQAQDQLEIELEHAAEVLREAKETWFLQCATALDVDRPDDQAAWDALTTAQASKQTALDEHEAAVRAALQAYNDCSGSSGGCGGTLTGESSAWTAALACLECVPDIEMVCDEPSAPADAVTLGDELGLQDHTVNERWLALVIAEIFNSNPSIGSKPVANDHTTFDGIGFFGGFFDDLFVSQLEETHPCTGGESSLVMCASPATPLPPGDYHVVLFHTAAPMPHSSGMHRQLSVVFDQNGVASDNYQPPPMYANDFWQDTDRAYAASYDPVGDAWDLRVQDISNGVFTDIASDARMILQGGAGALIVPANELESAAPGLRITNYEHDGNWGQTEGSPWEGSIFPAVADGLYTVP